MSKLIRDNIPNIMSMNGEDPHVLYNVADDIYRQALHNKLIEEADEFKQKPSVEEMADILEVCNYLAAIYGISWDDVQKCRLAKFNERGGFDKRIILIEDEPDTLVDN